MMIALLSLLVVGFVGAIALWAWVSWHWTNDPNE